MFMGERQRGAGCACGEWFAEGPPAPLDRQHDTGMRLRCLEHGSHCILGAVALRGPPL